MEKWVKIIILVLLVLASTLTLSCPLLAINGKSNQATLRGLKGVGVLVEHLPPEVEKEGLTKSQLQMDIESKLKMAGIKVLTKDEVFRTPGEPHLYINVNVNMAKTESDIYPYSIDILLIQQVSLLRDPNLTTFAVTWSKGGVGSIGKPILSQLQDYVKELVDIFTKAYLEENPK